MDLKFNMDSSREILVACKELRNLRTDKERTKLEARYYIQGIATPN